MKVEYFLDTNVVVYAVSKAPEDQTKRAKSLQIIEAGGFGVSSQVLQEFYVTVTRKARIGLAASKALEWIEQLAMQPCIAIDSTIVMRAIEFSERYRVSYWDGAILAAAEAMGATTVISEDLARGRDYGGIRVSNPYVS